jgi:2-polyprenyl-3-methyl-5-hydroxy-6-metoxy-1,4-benzoquinol methylase
MDIEAIRQERLELIDRYGIWTDHNIQLADGISTMDAAGPSAKLRRIVQIVSDLAAKPLRDMRILDLACLEGLYSVEFARRGARVVGIEGREPNIEKAKFAKRVLALENLEFVLGDVRDLSRERYGEFDIVLCLGILYHLDAPDVFRFIQKISEVCRGFAVFDTYISLAPKRRYAFEGKEFWGREIIEHRANEDAGEKLTWLWSSLENDSSVWLTRHTLLNSLIGVGFTSVYDCEAPVELEKPLDRVTFVAVKGARSELLTQPGAAQTLPDELPETLVRTPSLHQKPFADASRAVTQLLPRSWRRGVKSALRAANVMRSPKERWEGNDRFKW